MGLNGEVGEYRRREDVPGRGIVCTKTIRDDNLS